MYLALSYIVCIILYNRFSFFIMQFDADNKFNQSINITDSLIRSIGLALSQHYYTYFLQKSLMIAQAPMVRTTE